MVKIVADDKIPFLRGVLEPFAEVVYKSGSAITAADVRDADALLIRTRTRCDRDLLEGSRVRFIGTATIGFDHINTAYCAQRGIAVATAAGCNAAGVMHYIAGVFTALATAGTFSVEGKTLGIIGVGNVGSKVRAFARQIGMQVVCCDPPKQLLQMQRQAVVGLEQGVERQMKDCPETVNAGFGDLTALADSPCSEDSPCPEDPSCSDCSEFVSLDELLQVSDVVTLHVPWVSAGAYPTENMANASFFEKMRAGAVFINSSRGEVVVEEDLLAAITAGKFSAVILDVWRNEPTINRQLLAQATFATPHIAGYSLQGKANGTSMVVRALSGFFGFGLTNWYPEGVEQAQSDPLLRWSELQERMPHYYDVTQDSQSLKEAPEDFESLRNNYRYRQEFI